MLWLSHIFKLRDKLTIAGEDKEKPFLAHLDDLRSMIMRIGITLILAMVLCFNLAPTLMELLRRPADQVWNEYERSHLPSVVAEDDWIQAKSLATALASSSPQARLLALDTIPPSVALLVEATAILRVAHQLPKDKQESYIKLASANPTVTDITQDLYESGASLTESDGRGALKLMSAFQPGESFTLSLQLALYAGIAASFPLLLFFFLQFITPGLLHKERKILYQSLGVAFFLFLVGITFAYFIVLPSVLGFFFTYSMDFGIANDWRIGYYISFATKLVLMFGLAFQLPVIIMPLVKLGMLTYEMMRGTRSYAFVGICIVSAILTPPDIMSLIIMALPLYMLYEGCIWLAWWDNKSKPKQEEPAEETTFEADYKRGISPYHEK